MKVPLRWLKDYVDVTLPVAELAEKLPGGPANVLFALLFASGKAIHHFRLPFTLFSQWYPPKLLELTLKDDKFIAKPLPWGTNRLSYLIRANGFTITDAGVTLEKGQMIEAAIFGQPDVKESTPPIWLKQ